MDNALMVDPTRNKAWSFPEGVDDVMLITVAMAQDATWPDMIPGSDEAVVEGCTCPDDQPPHPRYILASDCPIHQLELVPCH